MASTFDKTWPNLLDARRLAHHARMLFESGQHEEALSIGVHALAVAQHSGDLPLQDELRHLLRKARASLGS